MVSRGTTFRKGDSSKFGRDRFGNYCAYESLPGRNKIVMCAVICTSLEELDNGAEGGSKVAENGTYLGRIGTDTCRNT